MSNVVATIEPRAPTASSRIAAIIPHDLEESWRFAQALVKGEAVPPGVTPEKALIAIMAGLELGMPPISAVQRIAVINNRPLIWGDGALGVVRASFLCLWIKEEVTGQGDARVATCTTQRKGDPEPISRSFSVDDAKRAGLWQTEARVKRKSRDGGYYEKDNDSPWFRYPMRMLQMRARAFCLRDVYPDVLGGLYIREEFEHEGNEEQPSRPTPPPPPRVIEHREEPPPPPKQPKVSREEPPAPPPPPKPPAPPAPPPPPAAKESDDGSDPVGDAMQRGYDDASAFPDLLRDAVPPEFRSDAELAAAWQEGFDRAGTINEPLEDPSFDGAILENFTKRAADARDDDDLALAWSDLVQPNFRKLEKVAQQKAHEIYQNRRASLRGG